MTTRPLYMLIALIALVATLATCNLDSTLPADAAIAPCVLDTSNLDQCVLEP